jgi:hypothetical protein
VVTNIQEEHTASVAMKIEAVCSPETMVPITKVRGSVTQRVEPLLCNDRVISKYTIAVNNRKHVSIATNRRATIAVLLETGFSTVVRGEELQGRQLGQPSQLCTGV